jgi:hypothetical protein
MSDEKELKKQDAPVTSMFAITTETKATNNAPLLVATKVENNPQFPAGWQFPICRLVNVISNNEFEKNDGNVVPVLQFIFKDLDNRQYTHTEWEVESGDTEFNTKLEGLKVRINHIYLSIFGKLPQNGIATTALNFKEFFNQVAEAFNSRTIGEGETVKKYYPNVDLYYKLTYYKARLGFPLSPNFLEKVVKDKPCRLLAINPTYDKLVPTGGVTPKGSIPGMSGGGTDDLPTFEEEYE